MQNGFKKNNLFSVHLSLLYPKPSLLILMATPHPNLYGLLWNSFCLQNLSTSCVDTFSATLKKMIDTVIDYYQIGKLLSNTIAVAGKPLLSFEFNTYLLAGLCSNYDSLVTSITTKLDPISTEEVFNICWLMRLGWHIRKLLLSFLLLNSLPKPLPRTPTFVVGASMAEVLALRHISLMTDLSVSFAWNRVKLQCSVTTVSIIPIKLVLLLSPLTTPLYPLIPIQSSTRICQQQPLHIWLSPTFPLILSNTMVMTKFGQEMDMFCIFSMLEALFYMFPLEKLLLSRLLHVLLFTKNLISVRQFCEDHSICRGRVVVDGSNRFLKLFGSSCNEQKRFC